jgi:hypothetical protein
MKISELFENKYSSKPICFVDMDGVLADLYNHAAQIHDVDHYNNMTKDEWETFFQGTDAYHLFKNVPPFRNIDQILGLVKKYAGGYTILSSPLSFDKAKSIQGKKEWIKNNINIKPDQAIFEHDKWKYATQPNGTPNVLIDDYKGNTIPWTKAGGIAIKFQNDEDDITKIDDVLKKVFKKDK